MRWLMALVAAATLGGTAGAQPCPPPPGFAGWGRPVPLAAAADEMAKPVPFLVVGRAAVTTLAATERVRPIGVPAHRTGAIRYAGLVALDIRAPGLYRVALGGPAWIDLLSHARPVASVAHGHAPECTGIVKMVDFRLVPGRYVVQLTDARSPTLGTMIARIGA